MITVVEQLSRSLSYIFYGASLASVSKLSPTLATAHYSCPDNAIGLVAQCELSGYVKLGQHLEAVGRKFSHRPGNAATVGVVRWPSPGDTAGYRLRRPKLTPVPLISMVPIVLLTSTGRCASSTSMTMTRR